MSAPEDRAGAAAYDQLQHQLAVAEGRRDRHVGAILRAVVGGLNVKDGRNREDRAGFIDASWDVALYRRLLKDLES